MSGPYYGSDTRVVHLLQVLFVVLSVFVSFVRSVFEEELFVWSFHVI